MSRGINKRAWDILNLDEQLALNLQLGIGKSTWQAGEVMGRAHYKYLEIAARGTQFLKMFTEHFDLYDALFPEIPGFIPKNIKAYLIQTMEKRQSVKAAFAEVDKELGYVPKTKREAEISTWVKRYQESQNLEVLNFINLVKEFDRWNNFRILPREVQEPSAFKRRNKNIHRRHIKAITKLSPLSVEVIKRICSSKIATGHYSILTPHGQDWVLIKVKKTQLETLTKVGIYLWPTEDLAREYGQIVNDYAQAEGRNCKKGLVFWPKYRELIIKASNYNEVQKLSPSREYLIMAMKKLEFYKG